MAKNANAKSWALQIGELNRRWSDQPFDLTGPDAPTIVAFGAPTATSVGVRVTVAAVDNRTGIDSYIVESSQNIGGPYTVADTVSVAEATAGFTLNGLTPSTEYHVRLKGVDGSFAHNVGTASNIISQTTSAPAAGASWWPNWPIMNCTVLQGNAATHILDPTRFAELADKDMVIIQDFNATSARKTTRRDNIADVRALRPDFRVKFLKYTMIQESKKVAPVPGNSAQEILYLLINSPTKGNPNWIVHRVGQPGDAGRVECNFDPANSWQANMAALVAGLNSFGENIVYAFWQDWDAALDDTIVGPDIRPSFDGMFMDNFNARPPDMFQNNGATLTVSDLDYNANGTLDGRIDYSGGANAGGRFWTDGHKEAKTTFEARFPGWILVPNAARFDGDYFDGKGQPPLPLSNHPYFRLFELTVDESVHQVLGLTKGATSYTVNPLTGSVQSFYRSYNIQERMLKLDVDNTKTGKSAVMQHSNVIFRTLVSADYAFARFISALALLVERAAPCVQVDARAPLSLDETLIELGNPVGARTMGTLNETTLGFSLRTANFSSGVARFYWAIFEKGMVLVRGDSPSSGPYPSADAAVACTLPAPPSGKKWQRLGASYTNPITGRSTRNQDPAVNTGADAGASVSLKPYHAIFLLAVPV